MVWQEFFPHTPRFGQDKIAEFVLETIKSKKTAIIEAPYGIGKTASMLSSGLASGKKIVFATSDHAVQDSIVKEVLKINKKLGKKIIVAAIIGKEHMCQHFKEFSYEACDYEKLNNHCPFYNETYKKGKISKGTTEKTERLLNQIIKIMRENPDFIEDKNLVSFIIEKCTLEKLCPYEFMLELASKADVVILDYFHIFTPIFSFMKKRVFEPENTILFIDEADKLKNRILDILTRSISNLSLYKLKNQIKMAMKLKKRIKLTEFFDDEEKVKDNNITRQEWLFYLRFLEVFEEFLKEKENILENKKNNEENFIDVEKQELIIFFESRLYDFDVIINKLKIIVQKLINIYKKPVARIDEFLNLWRNISENYFTYAVFNDNKKSIALSPYEISSACLISDVEETLNDILKRFHSSILFSATIGDKDIFAESLGIKDSADFSSKEFNTDNYLVLIKKDISSIYRERNENIFKLLKDLNFLKKFAEGMLISFPSYDSLNQVLKHIDAKPIQDIKDNKNNYYVVIGAKGSRGINKAAELGMAYIYGLQIARPDDYLFNKRKNFIFKKYDNEKALKFIYSDIVDKSCQIAGRIFRRAGKKGLVILADRRYKYDLIVKDFFNKCIPSYFKTKMIETSNQYEFEKAVKEFWAMEK